MADLALSILLSGVDEASPAFTKVAGSMGAVEGAATKAGGAVGGFGMQLDNVAQMATSFIAAGVIFEFLNTLPEKLTAVVTSTTELGNATYTLRNIIGGTTEDASALLAVFSRYGVNVDQATVALGIFDRHLAGIADTTEGVIAGSKSFTQSMHDLGVQFTSASGAALPMNDVLLNVADKFAALGPGADRTAIAMQLFGRSGRDLIPILSLGRDGMLEAEQAAAKYGLTLTGENVASVRAYTLAHASLDEAMQGVTLTLGNLVMPALTSIATGVATDAQALNQNAIPAIKATGDAWDHYANIVEAAKGRIAKVTEGTSTTSPEVKSAADETAAAITSYAGNVAAAAVVNATFLGTVRDQLTELDLLGRALNVVPLTDYTKSTYDAQQTTTDFAQATRMSHDDLEGQKLALSDATTGLTGYDTALLATTIAMNGLTAMTGSYQETLDAANERLQQRSDHMTDIHAKIDETNKDNAALEASAKKAAAAAAGIGTSALSALPGLSALDMAIAGTSQDLAKVQLGIESGIFAKMGARPMNNPYQQEAYLQEKLKVENLQKAAGYTVATEGLKIDKATHQAGGTTQGVGGHTVIIQSLTVTSAEEAGATVTAHIKALLAGAKAPPAAHPQLGGAR